MPPTYLVTGAAGFIGSRLSAALVARGDRVVGVDNFDPFYPEQRKRANVASIDPARFELVEADIRDRALGELLERVRPDAVLHFAALAGVRPSIDEPARYVSVNVDGLCNVLEAMRAADCRRLVFASSSSVYGDRSEVPFSEGDPAVEPISPYAATKRAGELLCHTYAHLFGTTVAALRFFTVYGPGQRPDLAIARFMQRLADGEELPMYGDGSSSRDYTYIDDIVAGVLAADRWVDRQPAGTFSPFNLGSSRPIALRRLIELISQVAGRSASIKTCPSRPGDVQRTCADLSRSHEALGYEPTTPLEEGLRKQWEWMSESDQATDGRATKRLSD